MHLTEITDLYKHLMPGVYNLITHDTNLIYVLLVHFMPVVALDEVLELHCIQLIVNGRLHDLEEGHPAIEVELTPDEQFHRVLDSDLFVLVHQPLEVRLLSLLHKEGLKCQLCLQVEGAHEV